MAFLRTSVLGLIALGVLANAGLAITEAHAEKLFVPVRLIKDAEFCGDLSQLKQREGLQANGRSERLSDARTLDMFMPSHASYRCGRLPAGTFLFFEGHRGNYACMRRRQGSDCWWFRRDAIGEVFALAPGRTLEQGNKGVPCEVWAKAAQHAHENLERDRKVIFAGAPNNAGERLAQGMVKDTLNMLTGSPNAAAQTSSRLCLFSWRSLQEYGRQAIAYDYCPQLGDRQKKVASYHGTVKYVHENCVGKD